MRVDGEIRGNVPLASIDALGLAIGDVGENKVVEFVLEHTRALLIRKSLKELGIIDHLELRGVRVDPHPGSRDPVVGALVNAARDSGEERLAHKEPGDVLVEIEDFRRVGHLFPHFLQPLYQGWKEKSSEFRV